MAEEPPASPRSRRTLTRTTVLAVTLGALLLAGAGLGLALSDAGATTPVQAAGCGSSSPRLTVQGTGQASATPDVLTAVFSFNATAGSSSAALATDNTQVNQALAALAAAAVVRRDIQTTGLSLQPQYAYPKGGEPVLTGYQVTNTVSATLRNTSTAGAAIDAVVNASGDAAQVNSLTFSFGDPAKIEDEARSDAVHQAVAHAEAMATAAGRRLGPVCSLADDTQPSLFPQSQVFGADSAATARQASAVPLEPGTQVQTDQVTMVYALES